MSFVRHKYRASHCRVYYDRITGRADENSVIGYFFGGGPVDGS